MNVRLTLVLIGAVILAGCSSSPHSRASSTATSVMTTAQTPTVPVTSPAPTAPTTAPTAPPSTAIARSGGPIVATSFGSQASPCAFGVLNGSVALPDPICTPGAVDPAVTQATLSSTICRSGYTSTVRPPESVTYPEKRASMSAYGAPGSTGLYEYDHLVSLEVGGAPNAAANLWPEPYAGPYGARVKDTIENRLHTLICSGQISLADAQYQEATDWVGAYRKYVGPLP